MRQRVLLAEESDTIREVAESLLRQGGYELIAVSSGVKALEVLEFTRPDLIILGSDLKGRGNKPIYEFINENERLTQTPLLILSNHNETGLPFPEEIIIPKPIEPKDFVAKVNAYIGQEQTSNEIPTQTNPLNEAALEDDFIDAALGIDNLDIVESEDMSKTKIPAAKSEGKPVERMIGFDHKEADTDISSPGKVESLIIQDENADIKQSADSSTAAPPPISGTGKIEILSDQFGMVEPTHEKLHPKNADHDYNWFLNELKNESNGDFKPDISSEANPDESQSISIQDPSALVDPITPVLPDKKPQDKSSESQGVDKFIDEFKKEVEKIQADPPESINISDNDDPSEIDDKNMNWQDSFEKITPENLELFSKQFISELAKKLAARIADKIDSEKLLDLIKNEIIKRMSQS